MTRSLNFRLLWLFFLTVSWAGESASSPQKEVSFARQVFPVLTAKCQGCHSPILRSGGMVLDSYDNFKKGGRHGSPFLSGRADESLVIKFLKGELEPRMPMGMPPLAPEEIELFRQWILDGAKDDSSAVDPDPIPTEPPSYQASPVITALNYSPDGKIIAVSGYHEVVLRSADTGEMVGRLVGRSERIHSLAFGSNGRTMAAVGGSPARFGEVQFWDIAAQKLVRAVKVGTDTLFGASFSPDGKSLAFGCSDKTIRILDVSAGTEIRKMENHSDWVFGTVFSVDGTRLVSVSRDHFLKLSDVATGAFIENLNLLTKATFGGQGELYCLSRHPKSDVVVAAGDDRTPRMYTINRPRAMKIDDDSCLLREFEVQSGPVQAISFSPDGSLIAVGGMGAEINVYRSENGEKVAALRGHHGGIYTISFHPDGAKLASAGFDGEVRIYDIKAQNLLKAYIPVPVAPPAKPSSQ